MPTERDLPESPLGVDRQERQRLRAAAEPSVWTDRMLATLVRGVKGGRWHSLIDKVWAPANLRAASAQVLRNKGAAGVDHVTCEMYGKRLDVQLDWLHEALRADRYVPQPIRRKWVPKPGRTEQPPLGVPTVRDRVAQTALRNVIEPIFEKDFAEHSYGFRPGRGCKDALRRVHELLTAGYVWVLDADLQGYFDSIPPERLMALVRRKVADRRVLQLLERYLHQEVLDGLDRWRPETGTPQGAVLSPLLANIYLDPLDHLMAASGYELVRYADDFVILCRTEAASHRALALVQSWTEAAGLTLHPTKTRLLDASQRGGFDFLGYHFERGMHWPSKKARARLRERLRPLTRRTNGHSLACIVARLNPVLRGWYTYFQHGRPYDLPPLDGWVRMRLRALQRKRHKHKGRGRRRDRQRWPNAFFAELGLFSMAAAHAQACQPARR